METPELGVGSQDSGVEPAEQVEDRAPTTEETPPRSQDEMEAAVAPLTRGQIVKGLIVHIDDDGALVDVGTKSEGHVEPGELAGGTTDDGKPLEVGDKISVYVVRPEDDEGRSVLSKKRADYERVWRRVIEAHEKGEVLSAMVTDRVKGGLVVDLGLRGFLPASHVRTRNVHALDRFIGQSLRVKIIEVDRGRKRVVVSHKNAIEEERRQRREKTLASLEENKVYRGVVRRITNYGAFVDLGGVDGLLHITEMSWTRIDNPSDVVKVGGKIDVMVLRLDRDRNRISLGLKQILPDPWEEVPKNYSVGQIVHGKVTRVVPFGAFVRLESGIEGIIPNAELPGERGKRAADVLSPGQEVDVKIVNIRSGKRRMTLSLRQFEQAKERQQIKDYMQRQEADSRVTIGDLFGSVLAGTQAAQQHGEPEAEGSAAETPPAPDEVATSAGKTQEQTEEFEAEAAVGEPPAEELASPAAEEPTDTSGSHTSPEAGPARGEEGHEPSQDAEAACSSSESPEESEAARE
jgi:4-hydroxy-3-methylbut-2-enyl diphosphate reductase